MTKSRVLMLDDDPDVGAFVLNVPERLGYEICFTDRSDAFQGAYRSFCPEVVILDPAVPNMDGMEILEPIPEAQIQEQAIGRVKRRSVRRIVARRTMAATVRA